MSLRETLLDTPADEVPDALAELVASFCDPILAIRAAFVGLIEIVKDFEHPARQLAVAFELEEPDAGTPEGDRELRLVTDRFYGSMPPEIQAGGCNFLEAGGLVVWKAKARRVYPRADAASP